MRIKNPILPGTHPDPSVCRVGGDYYLVTSSFGYFPGVPIFHSTDLVNWQQIGHVLTRQSQLNFDNRRYPSALFSAEEHGSPSCAGIWAPTIRYHQDRFYMITTHVDGIGNFFVTAEDPAGPWSDPITIDVEGIDPSLFFDDDGKIYYTRRGTGGIVQAEIDLESGQLKNRPRVIVKQYICQDIEGPHLYKINGQYYLMAAEGGTRFGHCEVIGRSASPWGPYLPCPHNPILTHRDQSHRIIRDVGHAELVEDVSGKTWLFCLGTRHQHYNSASILGRETFLAPVRWTEDGWPVIGLPGEEHRIPEAFESDCLPAQTAPTTNGWDDFDRPELDMKWNFIQNVSPAAWSLVERPGYLRLKGTANTLSDLGGPAFVGLRQDQFDVTASCQVEFAPQGENEEAGLTVFINNLHHYDLAITQRDGLRCVVLRKYVGDLYQEFRRDIAENGKVTLSVTCDGRGYRFSFLDSSGNREQAGSGLARFLSPEIADDDWVWTGVFLGMYASGQGQPCRSPADFDWFSYKPR